MDTNIADLLQACYENHCSEGEFNILGKTIRVFTKEPTYQKDKDGFNDYSKDPIAYGGHKCAFIDDTYWTGWYCPDLGNDLKYCMEDVTKKLFESANIKFTITGTLKEKVFPQYIDNYLPEDWYDEEVYYHDPEESGNFTDEELSEYLKKELESSLTVDDLDIKSINIIELDRVNHTFKVEVILENYILFDFFKDEDDLISSYDAGKYVIDSISYSFEHEEEIQKYMKEAFNYSISFY